MWDRNALRPSALRAIIAAARSPRLRRWGLAPRDVLRRTPASMPREKRPIVGLLSLVQCSQGLALTAPVHGQARMHTQKVVSCTVASAACDTCSVVRHACWDERSAKVGATDGALSYARSDCFALVACALLDARRVLVVDTSRTVDRSTCAAHAIDRRRATRATISARATMEHRVS